MYKIINSQLLEEFWCRNPKTEDSLKAWYYLAKEQSWENSAEVLKTFPNAILEDRNHVSFPIVSSGCFLMASLHFGLKTLKICCVGSFHQSDE